MTQHQWFMPSTICPLYLVASEKGLQGAYFNKQRAPMAESLRESEPAVRVLAQAVSQLEEYFAGKRKSFDVPLDIVSGTPFQRNVWKELSRIPYGKTVSYKEVASRLKNAKAVRAVGSANRKNPLCILIPCHRVIAHDGSLGGYAGGAPLKTRLLELEAALTPVRRDFNSRR